MDDSTICRRFPAYCIVKCVERRADSIACTRRFSLCLRLRFIGSERLYKRPHADENDDCCSGGWRLKKIARKLRANCSSSGDGAGRHLGLRRLIKLMEALQLPALNSHWGSPPPSWGLLFPISVSPTDNEFLKPSLILTSVHGSNVAQNTL